MRLANRYHLYVKDKGKWQWVSTVEAVDHTAAFRGAMLTLRSDHYDKPIRLEQEESPGAATPPLPGRP